MAGQGRTSPFRDDGGKVRNRRIFPVPADFGEGPFTEPTTAAQPWRRQPLLMPLSGRCPGLLKTAQVGGEAVIRYCWGQR
jgi:hypothetical protein